MSRRDEFDQRIDSPWRWDDILIAAGLVGTLLAIQFGWI